MQTEQIELSAYLSAKSQRIRRNALLMGEVQEPFAVDGLGEAVASLLMRSGVHPAFDQIALPDEFLAAGALPTLHDRYGLSTEAMRAANVARLRRDR